MKKYCGGMTLILMMTVVLCSSVFGAPAGENDATVTMVQGKAWVFTKGMTAGRLLKKGDVLKKEHEIRVAEKSRIEIRFPDGTIMRLAEKSRLKMSEVSYNRQTDGKKVKVNLAVGKIWAKVRKLSTPDSSVVVETSNAVAGVRGTVYRVNVEEDKSAVVKVYDGAVYVASPTKEAAAQPPVQVSKPTEVPGPHQVPPPYHQVTMEEWTYIVKAMQQINISSQGVATKPQDFDPKADADDWVLWNQERDAATSF
jgi:ferric-dicitrate binding protein FerR (iron transport regulator)